MLKYRWPWITTLLAVASAASPFGVNLIYLAFISGEQLSRNIAWPFVIIAVAVFLALGVFEWWIKKLLRKRRAEG